MWTREWLGKVLFGSGFEVPNIVQNKVTYLGFQKMNILISLFYSEN